MAERLKPRTPELTRAELEIMQILWERGSCFVNDILEQLPEPKPAYNTVSTVVRILEKKGFTARVTNTRRLSTVTPIRRASCRPC